MSAPTVVLVPGLRGCAEDHWQTGLAAALPGTRTVPPLGRTEPGRRARVALLDRIGARVALLDRIVTEVAGPVVLVAHSAGVLVTTHRATQYRGPAVVGALLATPPTLADELPPEYPSIRVLRAHGWLPIPRRPLPFPSIVAASTDGPLANPVRLRSLAAAWGGQWHCLGPVGHLDPASGFGPWPQAQELVRELTEGTVR
ncbi:MAG: alpha/beta hydrolase, partial [Burkholderia sp.]|nr:alpha/beta hydrolase [Burkholderia sp.]